jgi:hypothetical protein
MGGAMSSTGKSPGALGEEKSARPSSWRDRGWQFGIALALGISGAIASSGNRTLAQITPDTSLGAESSVVTPNVINGIPSDQSMVGQFEALTSSTVSRNLMLMKAQEHFSATQPELRIF